MSRTLAATQAGPLEAFRANKALNREEIARRALILESKPILLSVVTTNYCNLRCIMCGDERDAGTHTFSPEVLEKFEEVLPFVERIDWQGGEFFGMDHFRPFFLSMDRFPWMRHRITTNGLLLDKGWIENFFKLDCSLQVSIDSPRPETYEYIRKGGRFPQLLNRLELIQEIERSHGRTLERQLLVVVMKSNHRHLPEFVDFAARYGFKALYFAPIRFVDTEENIFNNLDDETRDYLNGIEPEIEALCRAKGVECLWTVNELTREAGVTGPGFFGAPPGELPCKAPWKALWIDASRKGDILPDCWCKIAVGNISKDSILDAWNSPAMQGYRKRQIERDITGCERCEFRTYMPDENY